MKINYSKQAIKYLGKLDKSTRHRIGNAILQLSCEPPEGDIKPIRGQENIYRVRIGNYRVLFEIDVDNDVIMIRRIASRGEIYK